MKLIIFSKSNVFLLVVLGLMMTSGFVFSDDEKDEGKYKNQEFTQGIKVKIDGEQYYFGGMPVGDDGATDIPGHSWVQTGKKKLIGEHKNNDTFWSSTALEDELLYVVEAVIDTWSDDKAAKYYAKGFTHHHHMVSVETGMPHSNKVAWLKHVAVTHFALDSGPHPEFYHHVNPGVDFEFVPNWKMPYNPMHHM